MGPSTEYAMIPLLHGQVTLVDLLDIGLLTKLCLVSERPTHKRKSWRVSCCYPRNRMPQRRALLHRIIIDVHNPKIEVDHKNGNGLDNRRCNLRIATRSEQQCNIGVTVRNKLGVKGVYLHCPGWYRSYITKDGIRIDLGTFRTIKEASAAYNEAACRLHGEFAKVEVCHS